MTNDERRMTNEPPTPYGFGVPSERLRARWASVPGVSYPEEVEARPQMPAIEEMDSKEWMSTREAAELLGCTGSAARSRLHRNKVSYKRVLMDAWHDTIVWLRVAVEAMHAGDPSMSLPEEGWLTAQQACEQLGINRTSLHKYTALGELRAIQVRIRTRRGMRKALFYEPEQLAAFKKPRKKSKRTESPTSPPREVER